MLNNFDFIKIKYFKVPFLFEIDKSLLLRRFQFIKQRITRGFSDDELWSLDLTIAEFILPRLKLFYKYNKNRSSSTKDFEESIWLFETVIKIGEGKTSAIKRDSKRYKKAKKSFIRIFDSLWC